MRIRQKVITMVASGLAIAGLVAATTLAIPQISAAQTEALPLRSLTAKLVLAFLIMSLTGAALAASFTRWATYREFDRLVRDQTQTTIEALRDGVLQPTPERFGAMNLEAQQLKRLVDDLRTLSLADAGELPLARQPTAPRVLQERVAAAFRHRADQAHIALGIVVDEPLLDLNVDLERMVQVLENLVSNAIRHTDAGGEILLTARSAGAEVLLAVQDSGRGIAPDLLPHVFDRFYRGEAGRAAEGGESGLGLAIAKSIVEAHGGSIAADSPGAGQGATFSVRLRGSVPSPL
jgi:signal transduction histidine kinase